MSTDPTKAYVTETSETPLEAEATGNVVQFEHFGRTWTVPSKQRLSHMLKLRKSYGLLGNINLAMVDAYLSPEQADALEEIDPTEDELDKFTDAIAAAMGFKTAGN